MKRERPSDICNNRPHLCNSTWQACSHRHRLRPGSAMWRTHRNISSWLILAHWPHYVKTRRHPQHRKTKVHNVLHRRQRRAEPRPQVTCTHFTIQRNASGVNESLLTRRLWSRQTDQ